MTQELKKNLSKVLEDTGSNTCTVYCNQIEKRPVNNDKYSVFGSITSRLLKNHTFNH